MKLRILYINQFNLLLPGWLNKESYNPFNLEYAGVIELDPYPSLLAELDAAGLGDRAPLILAKVAILDASKSKVGTVLIPLQSAEGQRQRQGRHQG